MRGGGCDSCAVVLACWLRGGCAVVRGGCDDYSWVVVKELEFGVGYKRLRWGWLSGGVKICEMGGG